MNDKLPRRTHPGQAKTQHEEMEDALDLAMDDLFMPHPGPLTMELPGNSQRAPASKTHTSYRKIGEASAWAQQHGITSQREWKELHLNGKIPQDMPFDPKEAYPNKFRERGGWKGFLFANGNRRPPSKTQEPEPHTPDETPQRVAPFFVAAAWASKQGFKTANEWHQRCEQALPHDIPKDPEQAYGYIEARHGCRATPRRGEGFILERRQAGFIRLSAGAERARS